MLPESSSDAHKIFMDLRQANAHLERTAATTITLSALPRQLAIQLQVQVKSLAVLGGWWLGGSVLASKSASGKISAVGLLSYSLAESTITMSCFGSSVLRMRVLEALRQILATQYNGIKKEEVDLDCEHTHTGKRSRKFNLSSILDAGEEGKMTLMCKDCQKSHSIDDIIMFFSGDDEKGFDFTVSENGNDTAKESSTQEDRSIKALRRRVSSVQFREDKNLIDLQNRIMSGSSDEDTMRFVVLSCFKKLLKLVEEKRSFNGCNAVWLVFADQSSGVGKACPLRPRIEADWIVDEDMLVELPASLTADQHAEGDKSNSTRQILNAIFSELLVPLGVDAPYETSFASILWECNDGKLRDELVKKTKKSFKQLKLGQSTGIGDIWVHSEDKSDFTSARLVEASTETVNQIKAEIGRAERVVLAKADENYDQLSKKLDKLSTQLGETSRKLQAGMEGAAAQAASNPALKKAMGALSEQIATANKSQDERLDRIQDSMKKAAKEARGGVQSAMEEALKETTAMRNDDAALETILQSLGGISSKIGNIDKRMKSMEENLIAGVKASRANMKMLRGLTAVAASEGKMPPKILWMYPKPRSEKKKSRFSFKPKEWICDTVYVTFICPVTLKQAQCGEDGKGFEVQKPKETLTKAMPYIKGGLTLLKAGVGVGRALGLPIPDVGGMASEMVNNLAGNEIEQIQGLIEASGVEFEFEAPDLGIGDGESTFDDVKANEYVRSGEEVRKLMQNLVGDDWEAQCGLVYKLAKDGTSEWVLPSVAEEFYEKGVEMLGGGAVQGNGEKSGKVQKLREVVKEGAQVSADMGLENLLKTLKKKAKKLKKEKDNKVALRLFIAMGEGEGKEYKLIISELEGEDLADEEGRWNDLVDLFSEL